MTTTVPDATRRVFVGDAAIVTSRLLIVQSKRLMLNQCERMVELGDVTLRSRVEELRLQTEAAQQAYRAVILAFGSPDSDEYWIVAYSRLVDMANNLAVKMRDGVLELPLAERSEVSADVASLEVIAEAWTEAKRRSMKAAVA